MRLYNAISGKHYTDPELLEIVTLDNAIYMKAKDDVAFVYAFEEGVEQGIKQGQERERINTKRERKRADAECKRADEEHIRAEALERELRELRDSLKMMAPLV